MSPLVDVGVGAADEGEVQVQVVELRGMNFNPVQVIGAAYFNFSTMWQMEHLLVAAKPRQLQHQALV